MFSMFGRTGAPHKGAPQSSLNEHGSETDTTCVAGWTMAQPSAMTCTTVTTRVVDGAVRSSAGVTDVLWWTSAVVTGDRVRAGAAIKTRS